MRLSLIYPSSPLGLEQKKYAGEPLQGINGDSLLYSSSISFQSDHLLSNQILV